MRSSTANGKRYAVCYFISFVISVFIFLFAAGNRTQTIAIAQSENIEQELTEEVENIITDIDLSELENYYNLSSDFYNTTFGTENFKDFLSRLVKGEILTEYDSIFSAIFAMIKSNFSSILAPIVAILAILLLSTLFKSMRSKTAESEVSSAIFFICYGAVAIIAAGLITNIIATASSAIVKMKKQSDITFPIVLLLMNMMGGVASVKAYQPMVLVLSNFVSNIFVTILLPIVVTMFALGLVGAISKKSKLKGLIDFFGSVFKWVIGIVFTIYIGFMSIQGITASTADGISIKTAKYAIKNYVPMLGGYISDGFELARAGALIVKNALGFSGIFAMGLGVIGPILLIGTMQLALKLVSGIVEPTIDGKSKEILAVTSKTLTHLLVILIGVFMMYFVSAMLLIFSLSGVSL